MLKCGNLDYLLEIILTRLKNWNVSNLAARFPSSATAPIAVAAVNVAKSAAALLPCLIRTKSSKVS